MAFSFGGNKPAFGSTTGTSTGFGFGNTATTSASTGFGGFGTTTTTASTGFSFGTPAATTSSSTGFGGFSFGGTTSANTGFGGFGGGFGQTNTASTGTTGFNFNTPASSTTTGFAFPTAGTSTGLGTGLGGGAATGLGTGLGGTTSGFGTLGQQAGQQLQQQQPNEAVVLTQMATAVSLPLIFGDERDAILAKWNQLQAFWGTGKGFFDQQSQPVAFGPGNPFCRFKTVGYCSLPAGKNADGLVGLLFGKPRSAVSASQQAIVDQLQKLLQPAGMLGQKPQVVVCVEALKEMPEDKSELLIYVQERSQTGATKRCTATDVHHFLNQPNLRTQLTSQLGVENVTPKTGMAKENLKAYLDNPPAGVDRLIWEQAKLDNPDPDKLLPVPIIGFSELHARLKVQEQQTDTHNAKLSNITTEISALQRNHANMLAKTEEYKRRQLELSHRVLAVIVRQEVVRKLGLGIHGDEEQLRTQLENLQAELNAPTQFKGRLNELMSQIRMRNQLGGGACLDTSAAAGCQIEPEVQNEIEMHLKQQQAGLKHLISIIKEDLDDLTLIEQGLAETANRRG